MVNDSAINNSLHIQLKSNTLIQMINFGMIGKALLKGIWILRWTAIIAALVYVGLNLVKTIEKALEGHVVVSIMEKDLPEYLFPSVTICSKYKDGNSDILPILWLHAWKDTGMQRYKTKIFHFLLKSKYHG